MAGLTGISYKTITRGLAQWDHKKLPEWADLNNGVALGRGSTVFETWSMFFPFTLDGDYTTDYIQKQLYIPERDEPVPVADLLVSWNWSPFPFAGRFSNDFSHLGKQPELWSVTLSANEARAEATTSADIHRIRTEVGHFWTQVILMLSQGWTKLKNPTVAIRKPVLQFSLPVAILN